MATSTITIISGASSITLDNTVSTITLGTSGPQGAPGEGVPTGGTAGQILQKDSATDYDTSWIDNFTTDVRVTVKNDSGSTLAKGTVVYVSGANGTNILVKPAIATSDATSATTIGFLLQSLAANASGYVITQGTITGLDTSAGTAGDPVWLSPTVAGGVVYGVANKPQAPNHLYSLGVLTRSNVNNGEIQVFVNNGWELEELHNVKITSPTNGQVLTYDSAQSLWVNSSETGDISAVTVSSPITGGGTSGSVNIGIDQTALSVTASQISDGVSTFARLGSANAFTVGGHTITNTVAATIPLKIAGAAGQSGAYFEVRDSANAIKMQVSSTGQGFFGGGTGNYTTAPMMGVLNSTASQIGLIVKGASGQTGNLQEWQDNSGVVKSGVSAAGFGFFGLTGASSGQVSVQASSASTVGMMIRGAAAQTANLQEWQNSAGTVLASISSGGNLTGSTLGISSGTFILGSDASGGRLTLVKATGTPANPGANLAKLYFRDGTTAGTLKLVVRAGAAGAETTILDNIPQ